MSDLVWILVVFCCLWLYCGLVPWIFWLVAGFGFERLGGFLGLVVLFLLWFGLSWLLWFGLK